MHQGGPADPSQYRVTFMPHRIEEVSGRVIHYPPGNDWIEIEIEGMHAREKRHRPPQTAGFNKGPFPPVPGRKFPPMNETGTITDEEAQPIEERSKSAISGSRSARARSRAAR
jgi:hypothetical protein